MSWGGGGGGSVADVLLFAILISFSPEKWRADLMRDAGNVSFYYFLSHITSLVLLIVS